jgi:hypothetical protein
MLKKISFIMALVAVIFTANCGSLINSLSATKGLHGFDHNGSLFQSTSRSESTSDVIGSKKGQACQSMFLFTAVAVGDASLPEARRAGGISKVNHITYDKTRVLGLLYMKDCLTVYGE